MEKRGRQRVWVPDPIHGFILGQVVDVGANSLTIDVVDQPNQSITASYEDVHPAMDEEFDMEVEDNCSLVYLNEATLLHNVCKRYKKRLIYSYVANILLAVNPYEEIPKMYSIETASQYKGKSLGVMPPHVFAIADKVYRDLRTNRKSQSIIVSGESGAGKTETTKFVLRYLTQIYGAEAGVIEQRIVEANPLMESFGNSKTIRNDNSSRFGKFIEVHFDAEFKVVGGHVSHYLLEKSRVCSQINDERNYHIFYHMLAGAPQEMKQALGIDSSTQYTYLNPSSKQQCEQQDKENFQKLVHAMDSIGMTEEEKVDLFRVTAAVLHLGNIKFENDSTSQKGGCVISDLSDPTVVGVARLLALDADDLRRSLTSRVMTTTKKGAVGTVINVPFKPEQAVNARDALAKAIYTRLFSWTVQRINKCFPFVTSRYYVGVLDIAGFEYYQFNSFEQFCINYCNEKLQQLFNQRVLKEEQDLYKREGLGLPTVKYVDNQDCIDLIECMGTGIIDLLDEECRLPRGTNENFTSAIHSKHKGHFRLLLPRGSKLNQHRSLRDEEGFIVRHFAGAVCYKTTGFLEKNNDALHSNLEQLLATSNDGFVRSLFEGSSSSTSGTSHAKKLVLESVSSKFRTQLNQLMEKLRTTEASFIRCLKPNQEMLPQKFIGGQVLSQLQCAGMVAVLKLMEGGYPSRTQFIDLYNMYKSVLPAKLVKLDPRTFCEALFRAIGIKGREFKFGQNKVFFKAGKFAEFDQMMQTDITKLSVMVSRVQQWLIHKQWRKVIYGAISVQKLSRKIKYRQENALIIQSAVRMMLAMNKYRPRYKGIIQLQQLKRGIEESNSLALKLKTNQAAMTEKAVKLNASIDEKIHKLKLSPIPKEQIEVEYSQLMDNVKAFMLELQARQEQEKVEEEERKIMQILLQKQEQERLDREEMARKKQQEEKERMEEKAKYLEALKIQEEKLKQENLDMMLAAQQEQEEHIMIAKEQERRDFELALRLAQSERQSQSMITEQFKMQQKFQLTLTETETKIKASIKSYNLTKWKYAQLRDTINTSCDMKLLAACRDELHRRLQVYHAWRDKSTSQTNQRIPTDALDQSTHRGMEAEVLSMKHRYFRVPFLRPSSDDQANKTRGWWYAHFDGHWIARQLELHPNQPPMLFYAGIDDMEMCELRLEETGLTRKKGAEISKEQFEEVWNKYGGKPYKPPSTQL